MILSIGTSLLAFCAMFICFFLILIARFFRLKSGSGISHVSVAWGSALLGAGLLLKFEFWPAAVQKVGSPLLLVSGGLWLIFASSILYKDMMSVKKNNS